MDSCDYKEVCPAYNQPGDSPFFARGFRTNCWTSDNECPMRDLILQNGQLILEMQRHISDGLLGDNSVCSYREEVVDDY